MNLEISERIKVLGFLMTCVIVVYHCGSPENSANMFDVKWNTFIGQAIDAAAVLAMCYFFMVTGFLLFHGFCIKNYFVKIRKRLYSLLLPYLLWQVIIMTKILVAGGNWTFNMFINRVFLLQLWPPDGALWYLYVIFVLALISPIFLFLFSSKKVGWFFAMTLVIIIYRLNFLSNPMVIAFRSYGYMANILFYLPSYIIGAYYGLHMNKTYNAEQLKYVLAMLFVAMFFECLYDGFLYDLTKKSMPIFLLYFFPVTTHIKEKKRKYINYHF